MSIRDRDDNRKRKEKEKAAPLFGDGDDQFDMSIIFAPEHIEVIKFVMEEGKAIRFGLTSDGGALCVALYEGGQAKNQYMRTPEEVDRYFTRLYRYVKGSDEL